MLIEYKKLLTAAIKTTWENKYLWFFGLFAAFLAGGITYRGVYSSDNSGFINGWQKVKGTGVFDFSIFSQMAELAKADPVGLSARLAMLIFVMLLGVFIFWLAIVCQGALINSVAKVNLGKKTDFTDGMQNGVKNFWLVLALKIIEQVVTFALLSIMLLPFAIYLSSSSSVGLILVYYLLTIIVFATVLLLSLAVRYSMSYVVIRGYSLGHALNESIALLRRNAVVSVEAAIIIFAVNFLLGFLILMAVAALSIPFIFLLFVFYKLAFVGGVIFLLIAGILALFLIIILSGGILSSFSDAFWTLLFIDLVKKDKASFIGYLLNFRR